MRKNEHVGFVRQEDCDTVGKTCRSDRRHLGTRVSLFVGVYGLFLNLSLL
jgi:hypothetical protein